MMSAELAMNSMGSTAQFHVTCLQTVILRDASGSPPNSDGSQDAAGLLQSIYRGTRQCSD
jgi:hypothetical protein